MKENEIRIFTDGSSRGNPGPGGWGAVITNTKKIRELGGGEKDTTNNRMELTAIIRALQALKNTNKHITVFTDSQYAINGITKWVEGWRTNGWVTKAKGQVLNKDLWEELVPVTETLSITWKHVAGHVGIVGNERADAIATSFADEVDIQLYDGPVGEYRLNVSQVTVDEKKRKEKKRRGGKAFSYLSQVNGEIERHETWADCQTRVEGRSGVKYRKSLSLVDEQKIIQEWKEEL